MLDETDISKAVAKIIDFADFYLRLGDVKGPDLLVAIAERDPAFTWYIEGVSDRIETMLDFFRVYAEWAISRIREECGVPWDEVRDACRQSRQYQLLQMQWRDFTGLWAELERLLDMGIKR